MSLIKDLQEIFMLLTTGEKMQDSIFERNMSTSAMHLLQSIDFLEHQSCLVFVKIVDMFVTHGTSSSQ
jgi:hypothetical protein